jgi:hypothetical protein
MKLSALRVKNCRSIESATLEGLDRINVLIGRNNAGKSAFFHAVHYVAQHLVGHPTDWTRTVRRADPKSHLSIELEFELSNAERKEFLRTVPQQVGDAGVALNSVLASPAFRKVRFRCGNAPPHAPGLHLCATEVLASDAQWATIQEIRELTGSTNPTCYFATLENLGLSGSFSLSAIALKQGIAESSQHISFQDWISLGEQRPRSFFFQALFVKFLRNAFFLQAVRSTADQQVADVRGLLSQDGSNLPQALLSVRTNNTKQFAEVESFVAAALPDAGQLHTPMEGIQTRVGFRQSDIASPIPLVDMGTGVQHIVMVGLILATTNKESALFIEEPEANLHPGAQRYLLDRLQRDGRQVFVTTHSPIFLSPGVESAVYRVTSHANSTTAQKLNDAASLGSALEEIGARNGDLLLSDAVLFVEGASDKSILSAWAANVGCSFESRNITILPVGSTEAVRRDGRARIEVLQSISTATPVPYRFLLDRDERSEAELAQLRQVLGDELTVLRCREIENCLMVPRVLCEYIAERVAADGNAEVQSLSEIGVRTLMVETAKSLRGVVLSKRVRAEMPQFEGGVFPRQLAMELASTVDEVDWVDRIQAALGTRHRDWLFNSQLSEIVKRERDRIQCDWATEESMLKHAPGEEVLQRVFAAYGLNYDKLRDGPSIARRMTEAEMPLEVMSILKWLTAEPSGRA